jgi:hypothetical protein
MKQNACWSSTLIFTYARNFRVTCNYKTNVNASTLMSIGFNVHGETHRSLRASIRRLMRVRQKIGWTLNHEDEGMRVAAVDVPAGISASGSSSHRHRRSEVPGWWSVVSSEIHRAHDTPHIASASITRAHTRQGATSTSVGSPGGTAYPSPPLTLSLSLFFILSLLQGPCIKDRGTVTLNLTRVEGRGAFDSRSSVLLAGYMERIRGNQRSFIK